MKLSLSLTTAVVSGLCLAMLSVIVWSGVVDQTDHSLRQMALTADPVGAVPFWRAVTFLGSAIVITSLTLATVVWDLFCRHWQSARFITTVMLAAVVLENALKWIVQRPRPEEVFANTMPASFSFPSGHALFATAFYGSCAVLTANRLNNSLVWALMIIVLLGIGASRIFLGVHYASDVLASYLAGLTIITLVQSVSPQTNPDKI